MCGGLPEALQSLEVAAQVLVVAGETARRSGDRERFEHAHRPGQLAFRHEMHARRVAGPASNDPVPSSGYGPSTTPLLFRSPRGGYLNPRDANDPLRLSAGGASTRSGKRGGERLMQLRMRLAPRTKTALIVRLIYAMGR